MRKLSLKQRGPLKSRWLVSIGASVLFLGACATTRLTTSWKDPAFQPNAPQKAVVIAVLNNETLRRRVEDGFVKELQAQGLAAVAGYTFLPKQKMERDVLVQEIKKVGADLVVVTTVLDKKTSETYVPPSTTVSRGAYPGMYGYYSMNYDTVYMPGYTLTTEQAISEVKAFDVQDEKMVWSATAETAIDGGVDDSIINGFCKAVTSNLLKGRKVSKG